MDTTFVSRNSRKTDAPLAAAAGEFLKRLGPRLAAFALLSNSRKTGRIRAAGVPVLFGGAGQRPLRNGKHLHRRHVGRTAQECYRGYRCIVLRPAPPRANSISPRPGRSIVRRMKNAS